VGIAITKRVGGPESSGGAELVGDAVAAVVVADPVVSVVAPLQATSIKMRSVAMAARPVGASRIPFGSVDSDLLLLLRFTLIPFCYVIWVPAPKSRYERNEFKAEEGARR
jgi:hypothetical protein